MDKYSSWNLMLLLKGQTSNYVSKSLWINHVIIDDLQSSMSQCLACWSLASGGRQHLNSFCRGDAFFVWCSAEDYYYSLVQLTVIQCWFWCWLINIQTIWQILNSLLLIPEMCSERDSPLKRLYRRTHAKLTRLAGSGQLVWAAGCELSLALVHARRPAWPGETSETILRVAPPRKTRPPDHTRVNWPVDASASGSAQVGPGGHHRWAARVQVGQEPARQKAQEGYPSHYTSLLILVTEYDVKNVVQYCLRK